MKHTLMLLLTAVSCLTAIAVFGVRSLQAERVRSASLNRVNRVTVTVEQLERLDVRAADIDEPGETGPVASDLRHAALCGQQTS